MEQTVLTDRNYTVLLCVDYDEKVLKRYNELLRACASVGGSTKSGDIYFNTRELRITPARTIKYNLILGLGREDSVDIAKRILQECGEIAVAFFDLQNEMIDAIRSIKEIFPSLICAVAINQKQNNRMIQPGELFSSPSEWLYFLSDYTPEQMAVFIPEQMEQFIAHLISSFVLHREKEQALAKNEASREGLRQILDASPDLLQNQSDDKLAHTILKNLSQLTGAQNTFLAEWDEPKKKFRYVVGTGRFQSEESFKEEGYDKKLEVFNQEEFADNKITRLRGDTFAPLIMQNKKVGLLYFDKEKANTRDTELLDVFAHHVAFAIENRKWQLEIEHKRAMEHELILASRIQDSLLPKTFPEVPGLQVFGLTKSAKEIGGDYFDVIASENNYYFSIGDVTGKGVPAGLIMSELRSIVRAFAMMYNSPREILLKSAQLLLKDIEGSGKFVSMLLFQWDGQKMIYSSAGHEHILHYHCATKVCDAYRSGGVVLGAKFQTFARVLKEQTLAWEPGDMFILFTDGAPEAHNVKKEMFKLDNLQKTIVKYGHLPTVEEVIRSILQDILLFIGEAEQHDDITLLGLKILPKKSGT